MNIHTVSRRGFAALTCVLAAAILTGCGGGFRAIKPQVDEAAALQAASAFHLKPVEYAFERPADWEITDNAWKAMTTDWNNEYTSLASRADTHAVYSLSPGAKANDGAVVTFKVTSMRRGSYAFVYAESAILWGEIEVHDAKNGKLLFRGTVESIGGMDGTDRYSQEGRIKMAHWPIANDIAYMIDRQQ